MTVTQDLVNTAEGIAINTSLTSTSASITGGASGTAANSIAVGTDSTIVVSNFNTAHGSRGYAYNLAGSGTDGATRILWTQARSDRALVSFYLGEITTAITAFEDLAGWRNSGGNIAYLSIGTDGKAIMTDATGAIAASKSTSVVPINTKLRFDISVKKGTTTANGVCGYSYYLGDSDTAVFSWEGTAQNTGTTDTATFFIGRTTGRTQANTIYYDSIRGGHSTANGEWFTHYVPPAANPIANLGGTINDIEPYSTVTINASASTDPDGTITGWALTQTSGPTVTTSGSGPIWTYTAPAVDGGTAIGWSLTVTDDSSLTGTATATHNVLPHDFFAVNGGLQPTQMLAIQ